MRNILDLTKREQRIIILIVLALVTFAFTKHLFETRPRSVPATSTSLPSASPTIHAKQEQTESDDSR